MQEPKYKVYVKPNNSRQNYAGIYDIEIINFSERVVFVKRDSIFAQHLFSFDDVEFLRFVGAYDKNGQELYNGDIISKEGAYIVWSERLLCWCFKFKYADFETPLFHDPTWQQNCEKIGNRFLNPELLGGAK